MTVDVTNKPMTASVDGAVTAVRTRLEAIDVLRGTVMVLMALDHVRDFFSDARFDPLDLSQTTAALFLTRWVTHFCAPVFVFLAGTGAFLYGRGKTRPQLAWFLLSRGLWLVVLELTLVHLGWFFNFRYELIIGQVIWAIGWSMVMMAGLVFLPTWMVTAVGALLICSHNLLDGIRPDALGWASEPLVVHVGANEVGVPVSWARGPWMILLSGGLLEPWPGFRFMAAYPLLPWLGMMAVGYGFGRIWLFDRGRRRLWLIGLGAAVTALFLVLRARNRYGDPQQWSLQSTDLFTVLDFLNCSKYPPSLLFVLMTLGPALLALAWFDRGTGMFGRPLAVFGRVPLFYYLLHVPLIHLAALVLAHAQYSNVEFVYQHPLVARFTGQLPDGYGYGLPVVYLIWLGVVLVLYLPCRWFAELKRRRRDVWLSYL
jgi:uncharacterized membrane protein